MLDNLLVKAETLWSMAAFKGADYPENDFNSLWKVSLLISSHGTEFVFAEDYEELYNSALEAVKTAEIMINNAKGILAGPHESQYFIFNALN